MCQVSSTLGRVCGGEGGSVNLAGMADWKRLDPCFKWSQGIRHKFH